MIDVLLPRAADPERMRLKLLLLIGQALALGTAGSLMVITGSSLFLPIFGSQALPYTYLLVAVLGSLVAYGTSEVIRRWSLPRAAVATTGGTGLLLLGGWLALYRGQANWVPFSMMVIFPFLLQVGFVFLGGQAGRLLDVRQIKQFFPQIVAGFVAGFVLGGLAMPLLVDSLGSTENVILAVVAVIANLVAFMWVTGRSFPTAFQNEPGDDRRQVPHSLPRLLTRRYVLLVVLYQMLAAMTVQLTEYVLMAEAAARYLESEDLAQFLSQFYVVLNGLDLFVLLVVASAFMRRFGLRLGLLINPLFTAMIFMVLILLGLLDGSTGIAFFAIASIGRILNIALEDGATRTSLNAAYQVLPADERSLVQTGVEGIGAPLALGIVGLLLLLFNRLSGLNILYVVALTAGLAVVWALLGLLVYRGYATALLQTVRRRKLGEAELSLDDSSSLQVVERLLESAKPHRVRLALDMLTLAEHPLLDEQLVRLLEHPDRDVRHQVLVRIEQRRLRAARPVVARMLTAGPASTLEDAGLLAPALITFCSLAEAESVEQVTPFLEHKEIGVQRGAMVGLLKYGGIPGVMAAGKKMQLLEQSRSAADRLLLAQTIRDVAASSLYQPLAELLADESTSVRRAALEAAGRLQHPRLLKGVQANLDGVDTRSAASAALVAYGEKMVLLVAEALADRQAAVPRRSLRLVRLCGQVGGETSKELLSRHLDHPSPAMRQEIFSALNSRGHRAVGDAKAQVRQLIGWEIVAGAEILAAQQDLGDAEGLGPLQAALRDEWGQVRRRIFLLLSFIYDAQTILRAEVLLGQRLASRQAMVLEMLDLELSNRDKELIFPLIDPRLAAAQRLKRLASADVKHLSPGQRLQWILERQNRWVWPSWVRACAIYAAGHLGLESCIDGVTLALDEQDYVVRETALWGLSRLAPARLEQMADALADDEDSRIRRLARRLTAG